jgi:formylglycine-generating enzyme required for sulfatase activity
MGVGELRPKDSLSIHSQDERDLVKALLARFRALPAERQRQLPALLNGLGKLQVGAGEYTAAQESFAEVAATAPEAAARAEASYNAYRAALEERSWDKALLAILEAAKHQANRFAPFPLHRYRPQRILGAGGFGAAFLCRDEHFEEDVVVKTLHVGELERGLKDVFREAQVLRHLAHPAIIRVRDCEYADGVNRSRPYLVMDYFPGVTLEEYVARHGALNTADLVAVARGIASAMQAAHGQHILHRDLKPANILVRKVGDTWEVKIIDFGLALRRQTVETSVAVASHGKTVLSESAVGTWDYAPPEQMGKLPGVKPGPYSDVFSFGRTCCYARFKTREPRRRHWEELTRELSELLERCIEEGLEHRVPDFDSVLAVLEALDVPRRPETERKARELAEATRRPREETERRQTEEREGQRVAALREAGLAKLREMIRRVFDRKNGKMSNEDQAILSVHCREHGISEEMARTVLVEMRKQWENELPVAEPTRATGELVTNAQGLKMVCIPAGTFWMGDRGSQKQVTVPTAFYIGVHPVTQGQWLAVMGSNPSYFCRKGDRVGHVRGISDADLLQFPVEQVSWDDVQEFLKKINNREINRGLLYRLPTEAEWEYSCRGGATSQADCSFDYYLDQPTNDLSSEQANFDGDHPAGNASKGKYLGRTSKVGSYAPNRLGIYDMHGNVWEWTADSEGWDRVNRGGGWYRSGSDCRASNRGKAAVSARDRSLGFRLAAVPSGEKAERK